MGDFHGVLDESKPRMYQIRLALLRSCVAQQGGKCNNVCTMRIVGKQNRSEFELDPVKAWHRGRTLDRMLAHALPPRPRGVVRATFAEFERLDELRRLEIARKLNTV